MIVAAVFGWLGEVSVALAGIGLIVLLIGSGALLSTQSRSQVLRPHPAILVVVASAIAVHAYHQLNSTLDPSLGFLAWTLLPYVVVLIIACFKGTRIPVVAGAAFALAVDVWAYYDMAHSTSSTASLALLWTPLWNTIVIVPAGTFLTWFLMRKIPPQKANAA